ncbi:MAG TPA: serine hydrolase, partial [Cyclobacteriaceae bacterium]|nr:serine hydrolase [Cyclobacteriaceae bacterium]
MRAGFFFIILTAMSIVLMAQKKPAADARLVGLEAELQKVLETWKAPGFAVAVVEKNKIIYAKGFGYSDYEKKIA